MKPGAMIMSMCAGLFVFCILAVYAGSARGEEDWVGVPGGSKDIEVFIQKDPAISGGGRVMNVKFVNHGDSDIALTYTAIIKCPSVGSMDADTGKSYVKKHSETTTSFSYTLCADDSTDYHSTFEIRVKPSPY